MTNKSLQGLFVNALDFRSRTAVERRERMRAHLIRTTLQLYAEHGFGGISIDTVIHAAGVARGTFYNYFRSTDTLLAVVAATLSDELMTVVDPLVRCYADPAGRVSCGVRTCLLLGSRYPQLAAFVSRGGPAALEDSPLLREYLSRDLAAGIADGRFSITDPQLAFDLVVGAVLAGFHALWVRQVTGDYNQALAQAVLLSLGVDQTTARTVSQQALPAIVLPVHSIVFN